MKRLPFPSSSTAKGMALMIWAVFLFSIMDSLAKDLSQRHDSLQVVWARYASQTFLAFILLAPRLHILLRTRFFGMQLLRSAFLFGATMAFFFSFSRMQLAAATAIFQIGPLAITLAAFFILKEQIGRRRWIGVFVGLLGAVIIIRPGSDVFTPIALLPLVSAGCFAGYAISTRFLGAGESPWTSFLYTALIGTIAASLFAPLVWETPSLKDGLQMLSMGAVGGLGHLLLIRALTFSEASAIAPLTYFALLFNTLWGVIFFAEFPDIYTYLGSGIIASAGIYVWYRETQARKAAARTQGQIAEN